MRLAAAAGTSLAALVEVRAPPEMFGIELVGISAENGRKLLISVGVVLAVLLIRSIADVALRAGLRGAARARTPFDEPVYNYTREFPYLWEEIRLPIPYGADRAYVERVLLEIADAHTRELRQLGDEARAELLRRYPMPDPDLGPCVYYRLTDSWLELAVRFVAETHGVRELKDAISRDILARLDGAGIQVASTTVAVVGLPPVHVDAAVHDGATR